MPDKKTFIGLLNSCFILLTLDAGICPKKPYQLFPNDINLLDMEVMIRKKIAKTKVSRTVDISSLTAKLYLKIVESPPFLSE